MVRCAGLWDDGCGGGDNGDDGDGVWIDPCVVYRSGTFHRCFPVWVDRFCQATINIGTVEASTKQYYGLKNWYVVSSTVGDVSVLFWGKQNDVRKHVHQVYYSYLYII